MPSKRLLALTRDGGEQPLLQFSPMCSVWALTAYDACDMRCSYCASYAQGPSEPLVDADGARDLLTRQLPHVPRSELICLGPIIDAYTHAEAEHQVTRASLEVLVADGRDLVIVTKGTGVLRDLDLLAGYDKVRVNVSLPSMDEGVLARIEPHAPTAAERRDTIEALADAGVPVQLHVQPWIPGMTDAEAMLDWSAGRFETWFAPLNVQNPVVARSGWGRRFTQRQVNEAYVAEKRRIGPRPRTTWARPLWLGDDLLAAWAWDGPAPACALADDATTPREARPQPTAGAVEASGDVDPAARDREATVRLLDAMGGDRLALVGMEVLSAHLRCYSGRYPARELAAEGPAPNTRFWALHGVLAERSLDVEHLEVDGGVVHARCTLGGELRQPFADVAAGERIEVSVRATFRYDDHGLLIEQWVEVGDPAVVVPVAAG